MTEPTPFDLCGPLPTGTTVLEASAGTGKTHAITALAVRYLAEGVVTLDQMMIVTFSRAATGELRHRVHSRLQATEGALSARLGEGELPTDPVDRLLSDCDEPELQQRLARVRTALTEIDQATIATTHEFCQRMLGGLGMLVDHDHTSHFLDDVQQLSDQVVHDVYLAHEVEGSAQQPGRMATFTRFADVGRAALRESQAEVGPSQASGLTAERVAFAREVRTRFEQRKRSAGVYTFDDMVRRLRDALYHPETGDQAAAALGERYPLVLIDEFQDTDPLQWEIVERAFVGHSTVVLIGDPKQAIYAFRGADVHAYLSAVRTAQAIHTLPTNHRSDQAVVRGVLEVFAGASLGAPEIVVRDVAAAHVQSRIGGPAPSPAVEIRCLTSPSRTGTAAARAVDLDLVNEVVGLLEDGWQLQEEGAGRPVRPSDIAILVRSNWRGQQVKAALARAGVPAVFGGADSVMGSEAAQAWLDLLRALVDPSSQTMKRAALGCLIGWDEQQLARAVLQDETGAVAAEGQTIPDLAVLVKTLGRILSEQGVAAVHEALNEYTDLGRRLLGRPDGERVLTDVRHVAQLLHEAALRQQLTGAGLAEWLADHIDEARGTRADDRTRRLETDSSCVQIRTIHAAKGLEFPIVLLPEAAHEAPREARQGEPTVIHLDGHRMLDVGVDADWARRQEIRQEQERAEALRTLYVGMTRASSRLVMWWAPSRTHTTGSPLHRLLQGPRRPGAQPDAGYPLPEDPTRIPGIDTSLVSLVRVPERPLRHTAPPRPQQRVLTARHFTREIDRGWRRTSYSGLTADLHGVRSASAPEAVEVDEVEVEQLEGTSVAEAGGPDSHPGSAGPQLASALGPLPGGTQFGSLVHGVLEQVDPTSETRHHELTLLVEHLSARLPVEGLDQAALVTGLEQVLDTPLGTVADGLTLGEISPRDRLAELDFELPMADRPGGRAATLADLASCLQDSAVTGGDAFAARYGHHLAQSPAAPKLLKGFLTGSIDAVLRTGKSPDQRFWVVDYKTNRIPVAPDELLTCRHYLPEAMARVMIEAHYPLQALLYCVALHRHLTHRLRGYRPEEHLGGVGYLFVRGMAGADTPVQDGNPCGVFTWLPSAELVTHCSDLIGGL